MKKQFFSILLSLFIVMLFPVTVFAEDTANSMITINAPDEICTKQDCKFTVTVSEGVTCNEFGYGSLKKGSSGNLFEENGVLTGIVPGGWGEDDSFVLTVDGTTASGETISTSKTIKIKSDHIFVDGVCECGVMQLTVPFTTTVNLGGNVAPGKTVFELEVVEANISEEDYEDVTVSAAVTTNGAGSYNGTMTFTGTYNQLWYMLSEGAFVKQVNAGEENWTYDDTVWGLVMNDIAELSTDTLNYSVLVFPATYEETENGKYYNLDWDADPVEKMTFTNTYTKSITESTENNTNDSKTKSPQTGDNSNLTLWLTLLVVSATGMISAGVYYKRKKNSRE